MAMAFTLPGQVPSLNPKILIAARADMATASTDGREIVTDPRLLKLVLSVPPAASLSELPIVLMLEHSSSVEEMMTSQLSPVSSPISSAASEYAGTPKAALLKASALTTPSRLAESRGHRQYASYVRRAFNFYGSVAYDIHSGVVPTESEGDSYPVLFAEQIMAFLKASGITETAYPRVKAVIIEANLKITGRCPLNEDIEANIRFLLGLFPHVKIMFFSDPTASSEYREISADGKEELKIRVISQVFPMLIEKLVAVGQVRSGQISYKAKQDFNIANIIEFFELLPHSAPGVVAALPATSPILRAASPRPPYIPGRPSPLSISPGCEKSAVAEELAGAPKVIPQAGAGVGLLAVEDKALPVIPSTPAIKPEETPSLPVIKEVEVVKPDVFRACFPWWFSCFKSATPAPLGAFSR